MNEINSHRSRFYRYCIVPKCISTTKKKPNKIFFYVPLDPTLRRKWCKAMRRDRIGPKSKSYVCEDHFNIGTDTENYIKYKLVGGVLKLKVGTVPHKFDCQKDVKPPQKRPGYEKRRRVVLYENMLKKDVPSCLSSQPVEVILCDLVERGEPESVDIDPLSMVEISVQDDKRTVNNTEPNSNQSTSSSGGASTAQQEESDRNTVTLIEDIKREEEYDDIFDEAADEVLPVTKEELLDIVNESHLSSNQEENPEIASLKKEPISNDQEGYGEPPNKKMKSEKLPSTTTDKAGPSDELVSNDRLAQETGNHLVGTFQQDPALAGMLDSSGNIDLFFESILALAKTLSPLDQVLLQRNVANVVFGMKITQLTKHKSLSS